MSGRTAGGGVELAALFTDGLQAGDLELRVERIATLLLSSGKIVACDPLVFPDEPAFERAVRPGAYPVDVVIAKLPDQQRIAAARVTFSSGTPVRFEPARTYGVDAGVGCFMDAETARVLLRAMHEVWDNYRDDVLSAEIGDRDWVDHRPAGTAGNVVIVHSGWGDGIYASYGGVDESGAPLCLVTSFDVA